MKALWIPAFLVLLIGTGANVLAIVYVSPNGNDDNDGRTPTTPLRNIAAATNAAGMGEEIRVAEGDYSDIGILGAAGFFMTGGWSSDFSSRSTPVNPELSVIQGNGTDRIFTFQLAAATDVVIIDGFTIRGGDASTSSIGAGKGGGIYAEGFGTLRIENSIITNNVARSQPTGNEGFGLGGGIYAEQQLEIRNTTVSDNVGTSVRPSTPVFPREPFRGAGGGVYFVFQPSVNNPARIQIANSTITGNVANSSTNSSGFGDTPACGGGLYIGTIIGTERRATEPAGNNPIWYNGEVIDTVISNNIAKTGDFGGDVFGGGIYIDVSGASDTIPLDQPNGLLTLRNTSVQSNRGWTGTFFTTFGTGVEGGGITVVGDDRVDTNIENSTINGNVAGNGPGPGFGTAGGIRQIGGNLTVINSTISGNTAAKQAGDGRGGGIDSSEGNLVIRNSVIDGNDSLQPDTQVPVPPNADGGGIFVRVSGPNSNKGLTVVNTCVSNNRTVRNLPSNTVGLRGDAMFVDNASGQQNRMINLTYFDAAGRPISAIHLQSGNYNFQNNIVSGFSTVISSEGATGLIDNNIIYNNGNGVDLLPENPGDGFNLGDRNLTIDPDFVDAANGNLHLRPGSPAVDQGNPSIAPQTDFEGQPRDDGMPDLGYDELDDVVTILADFGDAPEGYPVTEEENGARHLLLGDGSNPLPRFGATAAYAATGAHSPLAQGDSDDDGIVNITYGEMPAPVCQPADAGAGRPIILFQGKETSIFLETHGAGFIDAWIDFNGDRDWDDPGEQIATTTFSGASGGVVPIVFTPPQSIPVKETYARFRISTAGSSAPTGEAADGEVEDYRVIFDRTADISLTQTVSASPPVKPGDKFTVTVVARNLSSEFSSGQVTVFLEGDYRTAPKLFELAEASLKPTMTVPDAGTMYLDFGITKFNYARWVIEDLDPGASKELMLEYTVPTFAPGRLRLVDYLFCTFAMDPNASNNRTAETRIVLLGANPPGEGELIGRLLGAFNQPRGTLDPQDVNGDSLVDIADVVFLQDGMTPVMR